MCNWQSFTGAFVALLMTACPRADSNPDMPDAATRAVQLVTSDPAVQPFVPQEIQKAAESTAGTSGDMNYLRTTIGRWNIDLDSPEAQEIFRRIQTEGVAVFRQQPGFIRYRLMRADARTTIAVAEWESEELGTAGAQKYRAWLQASTGASQPRPRP